MAVVAIGLKGKEQCFFGKAERPAVCQYKCYIGNVFTVMVCADECGYLFNSICHTSVLYVAAKVQQIQQTAKGMKEKRG